MKLESYRGHGADHYDASRILPRSWAVYKPLSPHGAHYRLTASPPGETALRLIYRAHPLPPNSQRTSSFLIEDELMSRQNSEGRACLFAVGDEPDTRDLLASSLRFAGFEVSTATDGHSAYRQAMDESPDLIILDVTFPGMDGFTATCRLCGAGVQIPIFFLTTRDDMHDKIQGLTVGGDDYVTKSFDLREVVAHIRAILHRILRAEEDDDLLRVGDLVIDRDTHEVTRVGIFVDLSPTEFKLLRYLIISERCVVSKMQTLDHVWEYDWDGKAMIVESYISYLRHKPVVEGASGELTHTGRGIGCILRAEN